MEQAKLNEILSKHKMWLNSEEGGERADLSYANLRSANLSYADLSSANLRSADLSYANLSSANLSYALGLKSPVEFMEENFERTNDGYIVYKTFGSQYKPNHSWNIAIGSVISEVVNFDRCTDCGCGINVAPLEWVKKNMNGAIWKCLVRWEWLVGVCVPYHSDGKIRCERIELIDVETEGIK